MRKTIKATLLLLMTIAVPASFIYGQDVQLDQEVVIDNSDESAIPTNPFQLELIVETQSPWTKSLPIIVKVRPNIDTTRTNITWDAPLGLEIVDKEAGTYTAIAKGEVYTRKVWIKPIQPGTYTISATATDWGYGENVATASSRIITFGDNFVTVPQTADYTTAIAIKYAIILLGSIVGGAGLFVGAKAGLSKLAIWLKPPEL